ncbi:MAG: hypothetical protein A4E20_04695 [Nitrospira sp. SG-bin2]|nr:MAG: hypothetical protein A4E20_04695 [Nitrospira sp. SG-bin2]
MARPKKPPLPPGITRRIRELHRAKNTPKQISQFLCNDGIRITEFAVSIWLKTNVIGMGKDPSWKPVGEWPHNMPRFEDDPAAVKSDGRIIVRPVYASGGGYAGCSSLAGTYRVKR